MSEAMGVCLVVLTLCVVIITAAIVTMMLKELLALEERPAVKQVQVADEQIAIERAEYDRLKAKYEDVK